VRSSAWGLSKNIATPDGARRAPAGCVG